MEFFENVKKNFGFGFMRLPLKEKEIDYDQLNEMVDIFVREGFNYFDTARVYHEGLSEEAIKKCVSQRYPRESFVLTDKLSDSLFNSEEEIRPLFEKQLESCGVEYFDVYLLHAQNKKLFEKYKKCRAYETAFELKAEGKVKHVGLSFHDSADVLDEILTTYPQLEVVQIQLNYVDMDDPVVQSQKCYDVCKKHNKPVIVMEPVRGGYLANLPDDGKKIIEQLKGGSAASYAIRYAAGFENVKMVLSGMSNLEQLKDNVSYMKDFKPLDKKENEAIEAIRNVFRSAKLISCTSCRYCVDGCVKSIPIPDIFTCMNTKKLYSDWNADYYYGIYTDKKGKASDCIECGKCEQACPQHLEIRKFLKAAADEFDKK